MYRIRDESIRRAAHVGRFGEKTRDARRLRRYGGNVMGILGEGC